MGIETRTPISASEYRAHLIARGALVPAEQRTERGSDGALVVDAPPTVLRLDDVGRREAERTIATPRTR